MLQAFGSPGSFGFYAALNVAALVAIFLFLPETKVYPLVYWKNKSIVCPKTQ
jgi:hypothetical protein